jgi:thymidylate synthase
MALSAEQAFRKIYSDLAQGSLVTPRGQPVIEVEDYSYTLPPYARFANFEARKLKLGYVKKELLWYLRANPFDVSIVDAASLWQELPNDDKTINSNYGAHIFGKAASHYPSYMSAPWDTGLPPKSIGCELVATSQFEAIISTLANDKDSRRASAVILNRKHLLSPETKDYPCTYALNFRIRNNELKMSVHMRSQDAIFGMGNDAPAFSLVQELVFVTLRDLAYPDLKMGQYHHTADSFHVYERHFEMLQQINNQDPYTHIELPRIRDGREAIHLMTTIHQEYPEGEYAYNHARINHMLNSHAKLTAELGLANTTHTPAGEFSAWLLEGLS